MPDAPSRNPEPQHRSAAAARRLEVRWDGRLVELIPIKARRQRILSGTLGDVALKRKGRGLEVSTSLGHVVLDEGQELSLGPFALHYENGALAEGPNREFLSLSDPRLVNIWMVACAAQACLVSAMLMSPRVGGDGRAAGLRTDNLPRVLRTAASTAAKAGPAIFIKHGKPRTDSERVTREQAGGTKRPHATTPRTRRHQPRVSLKSAIAALSDVSPEPGVLRRAVGDLARIAAQAPQLGAGFGGLLPRDLLPPPGPGAGSVGLFADGISPALTERIRARLAVEDVLLPEKEERAPEVAAAPELHFESDEQLTDDIRQWVSSAVHDRRAAVRSCYEAWGLARDPRLAGRIMVSITLLPDGHVRDAAVEGTADLEGVARCVEGRVSEWYLGSGLVDAPTRMAFPFKLRPRGVEPDRGS